MAGMAAAQTLDGAAHDGHYSRATAMIGKSKSKVDDLYRGLLQFDRIANSEPL